MKKRRSLVVIMTIFLLVLLGISVNASAETHKGYSIKNSSTTVYSNSACTKSYGTIYASDEVTFNAINANYCKVTYPVSKGTKTGYVKTGAFLTQTSGTKYTARAKITTYRRPNGSSYGYIAKGDNVWVMGTSGSYTQVRYPVSGGYKFAWITTTDCNNYVKPVSRTTYINLFASLKGSGYSLSQAKASQSTSFTKNDWVYVWGYLADGNENLYKTYGSGTVNLELSIYKPNGSLAYSKLYNNSDNNWIGTRLDTVGQWKIQCEVSGSQVGSHTRNITVKDSVKEPNAVAIAYDGITKLTYKGQTKQLQASISPSDATNKTVTWSSSNSNVATVSSSGLVTAKAEGYATITVRTYNGKTCSITYTVDFGSSTVNPTGVSISYYGSTTLGSIGSTLQLDAYVLPSNATDRSVTWYTSNSSVATVSGTGLVTARGSGTARISAYTWNNIYSSVEITVSPDSYVMPANGMYVIRSAINNNKVIDVYKGGTSDGTNIELYDYYSGSNNQKFNITHVSGGWYKIIDVNSGKALDVKNGTGANGVNVQLKSYNGSNAQLWQFYNAGSGYYKIKNKNGYYLDATGGVANNGTNIEIWTGNSSNAQRWKLEATTKYVEQPSTLKISNATTPGTITEGSGFTCKGTITSNYYIKEVTVGVWNSSGSVVTSYTAYPNAKSYDINKIDSYIHFSYAKAGTNYYRVIATDEKKQITLINIAFDVKPNSSGSSSGQLISQSEIDAAAKKYSLSKSSNAYKALGFINTKYCSKLSSNLIRF